MKWAKSANKQKIEVIKVMWIKNMNVKKSENISVSVKKIENKNKMRDVNVNIKKEILALILMIMIKNQKIINFFCLHSWHHQCIQLILSTQQFQSFVLFHRLHEWKTSVIMNLKQLTHKKKQLFITILKLVIYSIKLKFCFSFSIHIF